MAIKKILVDYTKQTSHAVLEWQKEVEMASSMGDDYFATIFDPRKYLLRGRVLDIRELKEAPQREIRKRDFEFTQHKIQDLITFMNNYHKRQQLEPVRIKFDTHLWFVFKEFNGSNLWLYQDSVYSVDENYNDDEQKLLVMDFVDRERKRFERLKQKFSGKPAEELSYERVRIPEQVRIEVWRRDQGRCARCGSRENLEYDHIVPVSKGGSNTARNIELLCQNCNRSKGNRIE